MSFFPVPTQITALMNRPILYVVHKIGALAGDSKVFGWCVFIVYWPFLKNKTLFDAG